MKKLFIYSILPLFFFSSFQSEGDLQLKKDDPVVWVKTRAGAIMEGCANEIEVMIFPSRDFEPEINVAGASVMRSTEDKRKFIVIPESGKEEILVTIFGGDSKIAEETLPVWKIPAPEIVIYAGIRPVNTKQGEPSPGPLELSVDIIPDENLVRFFPSDAGYILERAELILVRGKRPVYTKVSSTNRLSLHDLEKLAQPGDRILIEIKEVIRKNFRGEEVKVSLANTIWNIPLY